MKIVSIDKLLPHERTDNARLAPLLRRIERDGILKQPVIVDGKTSVVLDGHHRIACLKSLKCRFVPAIVVDYSNPSIRVDARRRRLEVSKQKVLDAGLSGRLFPPKSSRHVYPKPPQANVPLAELK